VNWARIITNLVIQLVARVGKYRASPICPFLYHLYECKELLTSEEEKQWKVQEAMMKYGESGSSEEDGSGSGSEDRSTEATTTGGEVGYAYSEGGRSSGHYKS
jgi:hypothetical protein